MYCAGKLISVNVRKHDGLPGLLTLFLEYFDTIKRIKEEIYLDKNVKVHPNQQQIYFEEKLLDDDNLTLSQCGIMNGSQVAIRGRCKCRSYYIMLSLYSSTGHYIPIALALIAVSKVEMVICH